MNFPKVRVEVEAGRQEKDVQKTSLRSEKEEKVCWAQILGANHSPHPGSLTLGRFDRIGVNRREQRLENERGEEEDDYDDYDDDEGSCDLGQTRGGHVNGSLRPSCL